MFSTFKDRLRGFINRNQALILTYHSIQEKPLPFTIWSHLSIERFEEQIAYLARYYRCVSLSTLVDEMACKKIHPYTVAVTFDDGFRDNATIAYPILKRHHVPATIFLTAEFIGSSHLLWPGDLSCAIALTTKSYIDFGNVRYDVLTNEQKGNAYKLLTHVFKDMNPNDIPEQMMFLLDQAEVTHHQILSTKWHESLIAMNWSEAQTLRDSGLIEFGAHTLSHRCLSSLTSTEAEREIFESKRALEAHLGQIDYFAYPYGEGYYKDEHREMAIRAGYRAVLTTRPQTITPHTDPFAIPRAGVGADTTLEMFAYMLRGGVASQ